MRFIGALVATFLFNLAVRAIAEPKASPEPAHEAVRSSLLDPPETRYCVRDGESLDQRIERLETALRLAKAERVVNRGRHK